MKTKLLLLIGLVLACTQASAQRDIKTILSTAKHFESTVEEADAYFAKKYPGMAPADLCQGMFRDSDFVKFQRWQAYWKEHLNPDGTLGDPTAFFREGGNATRGAGGSFDDIEWTNINYENYIVAQIGMGRTTSIGFHPTDTSIFYVGAAIGGVWKTTDGGQSYTPLGDELPHLAVSSVVVNRDDPNTIYIALSDHVWYGPPSIGVYKSTDGGATWNPTALTLDISDQIRIYWMIADPIQADRVFVGTAQGLYRTDDGFETVELINSHNTRDVKFKPNDPSVVYQASNSGAFYKSTDGGLSFDPIANIGGGQALIAVTPLDPDKVYIRAGSIMKRSYDAGESFGSAISLPDGESILQFSPDDDEVLISGWFDVWKSTDNGDNFYQISEWWGANGLPSIHVDQRNSFINPLQDEYVYLNCDGGVFKLDIEDESFTNLCDGLVITQFYDIACAQTDVNVVSGGSQDNGSVYRNTDGEWFEYVGSGDGMMQDIDPWNANVRYWEYQYGTLQRHVSGANWPISPEGQDGNGGWETPFKLDQNIPDRIVVAYDRVYESWAQGSWWEEISNSLTSGDLEQLAIAPSNSNRIYTTRNTSIWAKDIWSNDWTARIMPTGSISDLEVSKLDMDVVYITQTGYSEGNKVWKSTDAGDNWENISGSLPNVPCNSIELYTTVSGGLFVGTDAGVYYRDDTMDDWEIYGDMPNTRAEDIEIQYSGQKIRVGTHGRGVLEADVSIGLCLDGTGDADGDTICDEYDACSGWDDTLLGTSCNDGNPDSYDDVWIDCETCAGYVGIEENEELSIGLYPNPTTGLVTIDSRAIPRGWVEVYNLNGQVILKEQMTSSVHRLDLSSFAPSIYTVKVSSDDWQTFKTEKIVVE